MNHYQICVKDYLDHRLATWFGTFALQHTADGNTLLIGPVCDQAALYGAIERCRDLGLTLISLQMVESPTQTANSELLIADKPKRKPK